MDVVAVAVGVAAAFATFAENEDYLNRQITESKQ